MKNSKSNLKKEQLISLWTRMCKTLEDDNSFLVEGSDDSPYYLLRLKEGISIYVSAQEVRTNSYKYFIGVVFGEFVNYKDFEMDSSEFNSLSSIFTKSKEDIRNKKVQKIVKSKENEFYELLNN